MRSSNPAASILLGTGLLVLVSLGMRCGGTPPRAKTSCDCEDATEAARASLPSWSEPADRRPPSRALPGPPRETVSIQPPPRRDPVDRILARSRRRIGDLSLHQAPVDETLKMFAQMGRFNVVMAGELGSRKVSLELRNVTLAGAFRAVLASARLEARVVADNIVEVRAAGSATAR